MASPKAPKLPLCRLFSDTYKISESTSQRLLDQSQAGVHRGKRHIPPILAFFGLFAYPTRQVYIGENATYPPILAFFGLFASLPQGLNC